MIKTNWTAVITDTQQKAEVSLSLAAAAVDFKVAVFSDLSKSGKPRPTFRVAVQYSDISHST